MRHKTTGINPDQSMPADVNASDGEVRVPFVKSRSKRSAKCERDITKSLPLNLIEMSGKTSVTERVCNSPDKQLYRLEDGCYKNAVNQSGCADGIPVKIPVRTRCECSSAGCERTSARYLDSTLRLMSVSSDSFVTERYCESKGKQLLTFVDGCYKSNKNVTHKRCDNGVPVKIPVRYECRCD